MLRPGLLTQGLPTLPAAARHPDLVNRKFSASAPNQLWVTDLTFVPTWSGVAYVCFIVDAYSRMIVGWQVASTMRTEDLPLQAFNHAVWQSDTDLSGLTHHSDRGAQGGFNWSSQHHDHGGVRGGYGGLESEDQRCGGKCSSAVAC